MNGFGDFLYTLRREKGLTQAQLAAMLGVTNKAVSKWETGEAMPETSQLVPLARIFGVTVDELLEGRRKDKQDKEDVTEEKFDKEQHLFTRGKHDCEKTLGDKICGAVCATVFFLGFIAYLLIGVFANLWTPYWFIVPVSALLCGIAGIIFDMCSPAKRAKKLARGENPYTGGLCGLVMLTCVAVFLTVSALTNLWHPLWIIVVSGGLVCAVIGAVGEIINYKKNKQ